MRRSGVIAAMLITVAAASTACGAGPSIRPDVAVVRDDPGVAVDRTPQDETEVPELPVPSAEPAWRNCTDETLSSFDAPPGPQGLVLECAEVVAPIDAAGNVTGTFPLAVMRARLPDTPTDVAPLVLTTGADIASTRALTGMATGPMSGALTMRPIVAVDRRGIGNSLAIDCIFPADRRGLGDLGQFGRTGDAPERVADLGRQATVSCTDYLQPQQLMFGASHAADDIERLRQVWGVDRIGLLGVGNGATVALAYAAAYPGAVGRLVLDSPAAATADAELMAESQARGAEAAVDAFAQQCTALDCALGDDPRAAIEDLHEQATEGALAPVSANSFLTALTGVLGTPRADLQARVREVADVLAAARDGDVMPLVELVGAAEERLSTDGQFVARCSDGQRWPTPTHAGDLARSWSTLYPLYGAALATGLTACAAWPSLPPPPLPSALDVPVLVSSGAADPVVGDAGVESVTGVLTAGGIAWASLSWQGAGYSAVLHSGCVQARVEAYLSGGELPPNGSLCPA